MPTTDRRHALAAYRAFVEADLDDVLGMHARRERFVWGAGTIMPERVGK